MLILGANSDIGRALAHEYARNGYEILLAARKSERLEPDVSDLRIKYQATAEALEFDAVEYQSHKGFVDGLRILPDSVICVFGLMTDQEEAENDWAKAKAMMEVNYMGAVSVISLLANKMEARGSGIIIGISSVAGERGRGSNYFYGSAKAGFTAFLSGLRNRMAKQGVHIMTVKPGFVETAMTEGLDLPGPLTAKPSKVAKDIFKAAKKKRNVIYTLWMWKWIMLIIRNIPEFIFKKLGL